MALNKIMVFSPAKNNKIILFLIIVACVVGGFFVLANQASAIVGAPALPPEAFQGSALDPKIETAPETDLRIPILSTIVSGLLWIIMLFLSKLVQLGGALVDFSLNFASFTEAPVVEAGWQVTRDLVNMGFAAILLFMAFATVLGRETYSLKKLLPRLIFVALLINFSLFFAGLIIDFSQVLTHFFIDAVAGDKGVAANLMNSLSITRIYDFDKSVGTGILTLLIGVEFGVIMEQIASAILFLIVAFLFFALALFLISRLVFIWILLIFAPIAWLSYIVKIPGFTEYSWEKWWSEFLKWTFFAPGYAFFIYVAMLTAQQISNPASPLFPDNAATQAIAKNAEGIFASGFFSSPTTILQYIVVVMILFTGFKVALSAGPVGAKFFGGIAQGVGKMASGSVKGLAKFATGKASEWAAKGAEKEGKGAWARIRRGTSYLSPDVWRQAWKARQTQKAREAYPAAIGARQDILNRVLTWGIVGGKLGEKTDFKERALRARRQEERGLIKSNNAEELVAGFEEAKRTKNTSKMAAHLQALTEQNDQNELLRHYKKAFGKDYAMDARGFTEFIEKETKPIMGEQMAYRLGHDLTRMMENNGQWIGRSFGVDPESGKYHITAPTKEISQKSWDERTEEEKEVSMVQAEKNAHIEWSKGDPQEQVRKLGRFSIIDESYGPNGETLDNGLSEAGREKIAIISPGHANRLNTHTFNNLVFNHFEEVKELNPALYEKLGEMLKDQTKGLTPDQAQEVIELRKLIVAKPATPPEGEKGHWTPTSWTPDWQSASGNKPAPEKKEEKSKLITSNLEEEFRKGKK